MFQAFSNQQDNVKSLNAWYDALETLTIEEINKTWDQQDGHLPENMEEGLIFKLVLARGLRESMSYPPKQLDIEESIFLSSVNFNFKKWENIFQSKIKK